MNEEKMESWKNKNSQLQYEYQKYNSENGKKKYESALRLQEILKWTDFLDFISKKYPSAFPFGIAKYGLDMETEKAIQEIDKIAHGEIKYEFNT